MKTINVKAIRIDGGTQSRVEIDNDIVAEYADAIRAKASFPPMVVFHDGADYWLADGFHRWHAYNTTGKASVEVEVHAGTLRDAKLYSAGANRTHGQRRTNADKRKAALMLLEDSEWGKWSDNRIASEIGLSHTFVASVRASLATVASETSQERTYKTKAGTTATMKTAGIGKAKPGKPAKAPKPARFDPPPPPEAEGADDAIQILSEENDRLNDRLAVVALQGTDEERRAAEETIFQLRAMVKTLTVELDAVKASRDSLMSENGELKRQLASQRKALAKLKA